MDLPFSIKKTDKNALKVSMEGIRKGWKQYFLLSSDRHHDNPKCNQELEKRHLEEALEKKAGIIDCGDLFCAMQGKYDYRSDKSKCRPEHQVDDYLDALVSTAADFYQPYAKNWVVMGQGNHELSIKSRHETDLNQRLMTVLNDRTGSKIQQLGYTGWIRFTFKTSSSKYAKILWFTHGYGGGGPVTEDMIQSARQRVYVENADIMLSGHVHRSWVQEFIRHRLDNYGTIKRKQGFYIKTPTYKDAYDTGIGGFEVTRGHGPRPIGAYWLKFYWKYNDIQMAIIKAN